MGTKVTKGSDRVVYRLNRVFYKELKEGTYKIVDGNMILLT